MVDMFGVREKLEISGTVAVVGSGPSLNEADYSSVIDGFDNVFRFNGALTKGFEKIAGKKTTHICVGLDLAYFSNYPFLGASGDVTQTESRNRYQNALILKALNSDANIITWAHEPDRAAKNKQHENFIHLSKVFCPKKLYTWFEEKAVQEVKDNYQGNRILERLGLQTRLASNKGMRTGFRTVLMLVQSGTCPTLFGFDIDMTIKSARHYYDNHINDTFEDHPAHDFLGEMTALVELNERGLIKVKG